MSKEQENVPKVFISYSWSDPEHELWVLNLAEQLVESGVDVIFDKWDLKEGHDTFAFMEKMVNDKSINKVIIVSDPTYAQKANNRQGGVGTEALIISPNVYSKQDQEKFIVVLPSKDENGKSCVPTYYEGRMYIDLSNQDEYSKNFDMLLRNIYNKPLYVKPELGKKPPFLEEETQINLGTSVIFRRAIEAIKSGKSNISGTINEYFTTFAENLVRFTISEWDKSTYDDQIVKNIELFTPARDELIQLITTMAQYSPTQENINQIHRFLENLIPYLNKHKYRQGAYNEYMSDNFKFIINELFIYIIAILIKHEHFQLANYLMITPYYSNSVHGPITGESTFNYFIFRIYLPSLEEHRNLRLSSNRVSIHSDLLKERAINKSVKFEYLAQADFVLHLFMSSWFPVTLLYIGRNHISEIFVRSKSTNYFEKLKILFRVNDLNEFKRLVESRKDIDFRNFHVLSPTHLIRINSLTIEP